MTHITLREDRVQPGVHPFTVPWLLQTLDLELSAPVTFLVGENGTGKSTLLEAIAWSVGFGAQGGNRDQSFTENADGHALGRALRLSHVIASVLPRDREVALQLGADEVISRPSEEASPLRGPLDTVIDTVGGKTQTELFAYVRKGGTLISSVSAPRLDGNQMR